MPLESARKVESYIVERMLDHARLTTMEIYSKFNLRRLEQVFSDWVKHENWTLKAI